MKSEDFLKELFTDKGFIQHVEGTKAQSFVNKVIAKLKEILDSIKQFMADATLNHKVAEVFAEDTEQLNRMVKLWTDAFKGAAMSEDVSADTDTDTDTVTVYGESDDVGIPTVHQAEVQTSVKNSVAEYRDDNYKFIMPLGTSAPKLFTARAENGAIINSFSGREIIELVAKQNYKKTGLEDKDVKQIIDQLDSIATFMEEADVRFTAIGLADLNNAKAKVRTVKDANGVEIAEVYISAMVNNGDYPVNFDMTTVCKRREAAARVIKAIALKEGQKSSDGDTYNVDLSPQDLFRINEVLSAEGFETACLGCFVESKRYNMQNWAESFISKWNSIVAKYVNNADYFEFATQDTIDLANINTRAVDTAYNSSAEAMKLTKPETDSMYSYEIEEDGRAETVEVDLLNEAIPDELWAKIEIAAGSEAKENGYVHIGKDRMKSLTKKHESGESLSSDDIKFLKSKKVVPGTQLSNAEKIEAFIKANPDLRKKLRISDLLTTDGIESIKRLSPALLGILSGHYGTATPKMMQGYTTYNSEIALLSDKKGKKPMKEYLKSVAGIRMNSFSDFKIETLLDYMQIIADMHIRGFTSHAYTKEIAFAEIFGKTGVKINVSIMFNVMNEAYWKQFPKVYQEAGFKSPEEAAKGLAGLYVNENGELDFLVADKSTRAKVNDLIESTLGLTETDENGNVKEASWKPQQFVQSAEFEQAVELMHREGYSANVGTIGVGYSKQHIIMMLNDSRFRYVIPYHSSSLPSVVKEASRLKLATDFTSVQNTLELSSVVENGEKITFSKESADGYKWMTDKITSFVEQGMTYAQAYQKLSDMMDSGEITLKFRKYQKAKNQHGTFDTYADLEATNNPKATCDNYLKYCADNGLMPMFYEFVGNENYYKLNFDFNVYDNNSGEYAPQNPVGFAFPDNLEAIAEGYMEEANRTYEALDTKMSGILDRLDAESKAKAESKKKTDTYSMLADAKFSLPETDSKGNKLTEQQREYFKDSKIVDSEGRLMVVYHGSPSKFTVFSHSKINSHGNAHGRGFYFTENKSLAEHFEKGDGQLLEGYLDIKKPLSEDKVTIKKSDVVKLIKAVCEKEAENLVADGGYKSTKEAILDTWVSNYADTYSNSMSYVYREVADILYTNDNDLELVAEITNAVGGSEIVLPTIRDLLGYDGVIYENDYGTHEYVSLASEQFKNIDNLTPTDDEDIRFSLPESDTASYDILARDNIRLQNQVKHLENEMKLTEGHKMKPKAVSKLARKLKKDYYSTLSAEEIAAELTKIFEYIADTENASGDIAMRAMHSLARRIVDSSQKLDTTLADEYKNVTEYLRKTKIRVSPGMESELDYLYGKYNNFRKSNFGRLSLSRDDGSAVDSVWQELNSLAPELFPEEVFPDTEMLPRISEVLDMLAPEYVNPYGQDADTFISGLAGEIFDSYFDMPEVKTFADKQKAKLDKEIYDGRKRRAEQRARDKERYDERVSDLKKKQAEKIKSLKADIRKTRRDTIKEQETLSDDYKSRTQIARSIILEYQTEYGSKVSPNNMVLDLISVSEAVSRKEMDIAFEIAKDIATELYESQNLGLISEDDIFDIAESIMEDSKKVYIAPDSTIAEKNKDETDLKLLSQKAKYQDMAKRKIEKRAATVLRHKIIKKALPLADRLIHPEKNKYVPLGLQKGVAEFLSTLDLDSHKLYKGNPTRFTEKLKSLYTELEKSKKTDDADMLTDTGHIESLVLSLTDVTEGKSIYDLDVADLEEVYKLVTALDTFVRQSVNVTLEGKTLELEDTSLEVIREIAKARTGGKLKKLIEFGVTGKESSLNAYRILDGLGSYNDASVFHRIAVELRNREKVMMDLYNEGSEIFRELANDKKAMDKFFGDKAEWIDIGLKDSNGNPVEITHAMLVSIYLMSLDEGNRAHISTGGLTIPTDQKAYKKGEDVYKNAVTVRLTPEQLLAIAGKMNDFDKKFAKAVQTFFDSFSKKYINETSVKILGYELAQIENYFPVISDEDFLGKNFEQMFNVTLSSYGSLKSRIKNATTPVQLMDVTSVVEKHLDFVAKYAAYAEIAQDLKRIYNYRRNLTNISVKKSIGDKLGKAGNGFFENLIDTVNDAKPKEFNFIDKLWSRATTATLAVNVSSTLKQFAAFPMAAATLGYGPLLKAMKHGVKKAPKEQIRKYTGMLEYRLGSGNITAEMSSARMGKDFTKRMPMLMDWLNKMDGAIVGRLWYASEYYVDDNFKELKKGSDEYYTKVAEIFTNTVFETQANYTFMERAGIQSVRWLKPFTAFKTDAYQAFGLLYDRTARHRQAVREYKELLKNGGTEEQKKVAKAKVQATRKTMVTTYSAVILSNVTTTLAAVLATTILRKWDRVKDDEEEEVNFEGYLKYAISEFLGNLSGLITFGNQIADIISVLMNKGKWYDIEDMGLAAINDFINSFTNTVSGLLDFMSTDTSEMTDEQYQELVAKTLGKVGSLILSSSKGLGIPLGNALNIFGALKGWVGQITGNDWDEDKEKSSKAKYNSIYNAYISGDTERYERLYDELIAEGTSDTTIKTQMKRRLYEQDSRVREAAIASEEGRFVDYVDLVRELVEDTGLSEGFVSDAVDYAIDKMNNKSTSNNTATSDSTDAYGIMSGGVYGMNQLITATKDMNTANITKIYNAVYEEKLDYYLDEGYKKSEAEKKAKSSIKSSITSKIKPIVKELYKTDKDKFAKLRTFLMKYLDYDSKTVNNWTNE
jgi:hypothetical protein